MKKIIAFLFSALIFSFSGSLLAQNAPTPPPKTKPDTSGVGHDVKKATKATGKAVGQGGKAVGKGASKAAKKTAEVGAKGAAKVTDKSLKNRKGPNGETVYVNKYDQKYYVDKNGRRIYLDD
ncbi:hypothetical protein GZH53_16345 [Flavihumibacter sp. R14]|nr:hypothetical protein [Flavihumibacter soli]